MAIQHHIRPRIVLGAQEHARLMNLAEKQDDSPVATFLHEELSRAHVVPDDDRPADVVRMGSQVVYVENATHRTREVTLVYPQEADISQQRVSILSPIGAALIGLKRDQSIEWPTPVGGTSTLTVVDVRNPVESPQEA